MKKKKSKFARMRKEARRLKDIGVKDMHRRMIFKSKELEKYCDRNNITGKFRKSILALANFDFYIRERAVSDVWCTLDRRAFKPLLSLLKPIDSYRLAPTVIEGLGNLGDKRAVKPLIEFVEGKEDKIHFDEADILRRHSINALASLRDKRAVMPLLERLKIESNQDNQLGILRALGKIPDQRSVKPLCKWLKADDLEAAIAASDSLISISNAGISINEAVPGFIHMIKRTSGDAGAMVRATASASWGLVKLKNRKGLKALLKQFIEMTKTQRQAVIIGMYNGGNFGLVKGKENLQKLSFAREYLDRRSGMNSRARLVAIALALNPSLIRNLPLNEKDARHKMDYLRSLEKDSHKRSLMDIYRIFKLNNVKL